MRAPFIQQCWCRVVCVSLSCWGCSAIWRIPHQALRCYVYLAEHCKGCLFRSVPGPSGLSNFKPGPSLALQARTRPLADDFPAPSGHDLRIFHSLSFPPLSKLDPQNVNVSLYARHNEGGRHRAPLCQAQARPGLDRERLKIAVSHLRTRDFGLGRALCFSNSILNASQRAIMSERKAEAGFVNVC